MVAQEPVLVAVAHGRALPAGAQVAVCLASLRSEISPIITVADPPIECGQCSSGGTQDFSGGHVLHIESRRVGQVAVVIGDPGELQSIAGWARPAIGLRSRGGKKATNVVLGTFRCRSRVYIAVDIHPNISLAQRVARDLGHTVFDNHEIIGIRIRPGIRSLVNAQAEWNVRAVIYGIAARTGAISARIIIRTQQILMGNSIKVFGAVGIQCRSSQKRLVDVGNELLTSCPAISRLGHKRILSYDCAYP